VTSRQESLVRRYVPLPYVMVLRNTCPFPNLLVFSHERDSMYPYCTYLKRPKSFFNSSFLQVYIEEMSSETSDLESMKFSSAEQVEHRLATPLVQTYLGRCSTNNFTTKVPYLTKSILIFLTRSRNG
jgi:hypothetical protein